MAIGPRWSTSKATRPIRGSRGADDGDQNIVERRVKHAFRQAGDDVKRTFPQSATFVRRFFPGQMNRRISLGRDFVERAGRHCVPEPRHPGSTESRRADCMSHMPFSLAFRSVAPENGAMKVRLPSKQPGQTSATAGSSFMAASRIWGSASSGTISRRASRLIGRRVFGRAASSFVSTWKAAARSVAGAARSHDYGPSSSGLLRDRRRAAAGDAPGARPPSFRHVGIFPSPICKRRSRNPRASWPRRCAR